MGTGRALDLGQTVDFFPRQLDVKVGDQLVIHNDDSRSHTVGPYFVNRGQTLRQTFTAPGIVKGICTIHPSGAVTIVVT
jgi:plastocyanin